MKLIPILIIFITQLCSADSVKEMIQFNDAFFDRTLNKETYSKNDLWVIIILQEVSHSDHAMIIAKKNNLTPISLSMITSNFKGVYTFAIIDDLKLTDNETEILKGFINRSGKFLSNNLDKLTSTQQMKELNQLNYELLHTVAKKYDYKVEESKKLLEKFNKK